MQWPQAFFSMFGALGGQVTADFAMEAFHDDMTVASRTVSLRCARPDPEPN